MIDILDPDLSEILINAIEDAMKNPNLDNEIQMALFDANLGLRRLNISLLKKQLEEE